MKRIFLKSLVAVAALAAAGATFAQDIKERAIKFGLNGPETHPAAAGMKKFAELVQAKSGGKMKVNLFFGATLGSDQAITTSIQGGTVEMSVMNSGILASLAKELAIFDFPFLFANEKESDAIVDGPAGKKMHKLLEEKGVVGLAYWELGYRQITNSKRPLNKVEDIDGLKLRVIPNPINVDWVKALGANPTPMPFPEVYGGLESKAIDGQENPVAVIAANKFWEVQKHMALTNHQYNPQSVIFSKKVWDTLLGRREEDHRRLGGGSHQVPARAVACRGGRQPRAAEEERHDRHRVLAGRSGQAAREDEAGDRQVLGHRRRSHGQRSAGRTGQAAQVSVRRSGA